MPVQPLIWMSTKGSEIVEKHEKFLVDKRKKAKVYRKFEYEQLDSYKDHMSNGRRMLESFDRATRYFFSHSSMVLGEYQEKVFRETRIAFLPKMFKDDLVSNLKFLRKHFNVDQLNNTLGVKLPRRSGKTECMALIIAITLVSQPSGNCNMYNLAGLQAREFLQSVDKYLQTFQDSDEFGWEEVRRDSRQLIEIRNQKYGAVNSVKSYACALKGNGKVGSSLRGLATRVTLSLSFSFFLSFTHTYIYIYIYTLQKSLEWWEWGNGTFIQKKQREARAATRSEC